MTTSPPTSPAHPTAEHTPRRMADRAKASFAPFSEPVSATPSSGTTGASTRSSPPFFAAQFFVSDNPTSALLSTLAIFAAGFLMRPIGGFFFGWLADRHGRRFALTTSMMTMAAGSLLIGIAPTHDVIGVWAGLVLLVARLIQGVGPRRRDRRVLHLHRRDRTAGQTRLWSTSVYVSVTAGIVLASLIGAGASSTIGPDALRDWAWRVPFLIGGLLAVAGLYIRRTMHETEAFENERSTGEHATTGGSRPRTAPQQDEHCTHPRHERRGSRSCTTPGRWESPPASPLRTGGSTRRTDCGPASSRTSSS